MTEDVSIADPGQDRDACDAVVTIDLATLAVGDEVDLPCPTNMRFGAPARLMAEAQGEPRGWFRVTSKDYDKETGLLTATVFEISDDIADLEITQFEAFGISIWDFGGPLTVRQAFSVTPCTFAVGVIELDVQSGKQLPVGASVDLIATKRRTLAALARVIYYSGETLRVKIEKESDITGNSPNEATAVEPVALGSGYANGDTITLPNGTVLTVTTDTEPYDEASKVEITTPGDWPTVASNPVSQVSTSGSGSGATFNVTTAIQQDEVLIELIDRAPPGIPLYQLSGLRVEDISSLKLTNPATLPASNGRGVAFSPDGSRCAVAHLSSPYITAYDTTTSPWTKLTNPGTLPAGNAFCVAFNFDGTRCAVGSAGSPTFTAYDTTTSPWTKLTDPVTLPAGAANGVAFNHDGTRCVFANNTTPFVTGYDTTTSPWTKLTNPGTLPAGLGNDAAFSPDGTRCVICHDNSPYLTIYDTTTSPWTKLTDPANLPALDGMDVAFNSDGTRCAVVFQASPYIIIYDTTTTPWTKIADPTTLPPTNSISVAFNRDGKRCAVGHGTSPFLTVYDTAFTPWTKIADIAAAPANYPFKIAFNSADTACAVAHDTTPFFTAYNSFEPPGTLLIGAGAVKSRDGVTDLVFPAAQRKRMTAPFDEIDGGGLYTLSANLAGTVSSSGAAVTGTGSAFIADFGLGAGQAKLADYDEQTDTETYRKKPVITTADNVTTTVANVTSNTALSTDANLTASADTYKRGGAPTSFTGSTGIGVAFKDTDGTVRPFSTSFTGSGEPDVPTGFSHPRIIAVVEQVAGIVTAILQPLIGQNIPDADEIDYNDDLQAPALGASKVQTVIDAIKAGGLSASKAQMEAAGSTAAIVSPARQHNHPAHPKATHAATITATSTGVTVSSVDTAADTVTMSASPGIVSGTPIVWTNNGTLPTGLVRGGYYPNVSGSVVSFHLTLADALAGTNKVNITGAGSGTRDFNSLAYSNVGASFGLSSIAPVAAVPAVVAIGLEFNFATALSSAVGLATLTYGGLRNSTPASQTFGFGGAPTITTATASFPNANLVGFIAAVASAPANWQTNQGTNPFTTQFELKGDQ